jgi:hypothetical protein
MELCTTYPYHEQYEKGWISTTKLNYVVKAPPTYVHMIWVQLAHICINLEILAEYSLRSGNRGAQDMYDITFQTKDMNIILGIPQISQFARTAT